MLFREFWVIATSGIGLAASPAFVVGDKLLLIETRSNSSNRGRWIVVDGEDYSGKGYGDFWIKLTVAKKDPKNQKYKLTRFYEDMDFSLPFKPQDNELSAINIQDIDIRLFQKSIWSEPNLEEDQFVSVSKEEVEKLFENQDDKKVKKLLLSLSSRRYWKKTNEWDFYSLFDFYRPLDVSQLTYNIKIKYFKDFESLKTYVHKTVSNCPADGECNAKASDLSIIDQDKLEFFKDPE